MSQKASIFILFICLFISEVIKSQTSVIVAGAIPNYKERHIGIAFFEDYLDYERKVAAKTITSRSGTFILKFKWTKSWPAFLILENETVELFLVPGDSLYINGKYKKLATTSKFSGSAAYANSYLAEHRVKFSKMREQTDKKQKKMNINEKLILHDTMYYREMKSFAKINKNKAPEFYNYMYANIEYYYANKIFFYGLSRSEIEERIQKINYNNEDALSSMYYVIFLENYLNFLTEIKKREMKEKIDNFWDFQFNIIKENFTGKVMDILMARLINKTFNYTTIVTTRSLLNKYYNVYKNILFYQKLEKKFNDKNKNY